MNTHCRDPCPIACLLQQSLQVHDPLAAGGHFFDGGHLSAPRRVRVWHVIVRILGTPIVTESICCSNPIFAKPPRETEIRNGLPYRCWRQITGHYREVFRTFSTDSAHRGVAKAMPTTHPS